jgi:excisionase family DNA binding protein
MATATTHLLSPADVAARLSVPVATPYTWRHRGEGPVFFRLGRHLRTTEADLDAWVRVQRERDRARRP